MSSENDKLSDGETWVPYYGVDIKITHPSAEFDTITQVLGLQPEYGWQAGMPRYTKNGSSMRGVSNLTYWGYGDDITEDRCFFGCAVELLTMLEDKQDFFKPLIATGGNVRLSVSLPGQGPIWDTIAAADLLRMGRLGVALDLEVFPHMRRPEVG